VINMTTVTDRICALFRGQNSLILAINPFLMEQFKIQPNDCRLASSSAHSSSATAQRMTLVRQLLGCVLAFCMYVRILYYWNIDLYVDNLQ
jgi:histone deacetylase complex regulatory component SIN3